MALPINWSGQVSLSSRWQTDVTRPLGSNRTERTALASKPLRTQRATISGLSKDESHTLMQAAMKFTDFYGNPVPIYCDGTVVTSHSGTTIYGDFSYKRLFEGGRVAILPGKHSTLKSSNVSFFTLLVEVTPSYIRVADVPRSLSESDMVFPCMDTEQAGSPHASVLTDTVCEIEFEWSEADGHCTLPALWPPTEVGNSSILSPICETLDNLPVFPFELNYADQIEVAPSKDIESTDAGRGAVVAGNGSSYHRIRLSVMGTSRARTWSVLRFFDSMQGRRGSFYLIHPMRPWSPHSIFLPATSVCRIKAVGDPDAVERYFKRAVFERANGEKLTRAILSVTDNTDNFELLLSEALPDTDFVSVQPILVCNFDSDELEEVWATNSIVPSLNFEMVEVPDYAEATTATNEEQLGFEQPSPKFMSIPGMNLLLRAGAGCYTSDGQPSKVWPGTPVTGNSSKVARWVDESAGPDRGDSTTLFERAALASPSGGTGGYLIRPQSSWQNNKQSMIFYEGYTLPYLIDSSIPRVQRGLWTTEGWTMFLCVTPLKNRAVTPYDRILLEIKDPAGMVIAGIYFDNSGAVTPLVWPNRAGIILFDAGYYYHTASVILDLYAAGSYDFPLIFTLHVSASGEAHFWVNGDQAISSVIPLTGGLLLAQPFSSAKLFVDGPGITTPSSWVSTHLYGWWYCANLALSYNRGLNIDELNAVHTMIADMFRTQNTPLVFY
jgi:hypothetical protein